MVLTFSVDVEDKNKVVNTMINMIVGMKCEKLSFNDLMGLCDLYHKYNGSFIKEEELERMIICKLEGNKRFFETSPGLALDKNMIEIDKYLDLLILLIDRYQFRYLYNYLLENGLIEKS